MPDPAARHHRRFLANALMTWGTNIAVALLSLGNVLIVARTLGPSGRGQVAFLTTMGTLVAYLVSMGVNQSNSNLGGTRPELRPKLATNSLLFAGGLGLGGAGVVLALIAAFPGVGGPTSGDVRLLALASVPALILSTYLTNLLQAEYEFALTNLAWLISPLINAAGNALMAATGTLTATRAVAVWVGGWVLSALMLVWGQARRAGFGRPDARLARSMFGFGLRAHAGRVLMVGNYRLDQWLVGTLSSSRELGLYSVAVAWAEALFYLPTALTSVQRPDLVRASPREAARQAAAAFRVATAITVVLAIVLVVAAPLLCVTIFGETFRGSIADLRLLAAGGVGIVALKLLGQTLTAQRKPMLETIAIAIAFGVGLTLDLVLIPDHGGGGAAIAATIAYTAGGVAVMVIFVRALAGRLRDLVPRHGDLAVLRRRLRPAPVATVEEPGTDTRIVSP